MDRYSVNRWRRKIRDGVLHTSRPGLGCESERGGHLKGDNIRPVVALSGDVAPEGVSGGRCLLVDGRPVNEKVCIAEADAHGLAGLITRTN